MRIAVAVIDDGFLLDALLRDIDRDVDETVVAGGGERGNLQRVQGLARVAIGNFGQMLSASSSREFHVAQAAFGIGQRVATAPASLPRSAAAAQKSANAKPAAS